MCFYIYLSQRHHIQIAGYMYFIGYLKMPQDTSRYPKTHPHEIAIHPHENTPLTRITPSQEYNTHSHKNTPLLPSQQLTRRYHVLSHLISSHLILSYLVLSYLILSSGKFSRPDGPD